MKRCDESLSLTEFQKKITGISPTKININKIEVNKYGYLVLKNSNTNKMKK